MEPLIELSKVRRGRISWSQLEKYSVCMNGIIVKKLIHVNLHKEEVLVKKYEEQARPVRFKGLQTYVWSIR